MTNIGKRMSSINCKNKNIKNKIKPSVSKYQSNADNIVNAHDNSSSTIVFKRK